MDSEKDRLLVVNGRPTSPFYGTQVNIENSRRNSASPLPFSNNQHEFQEDIFTWGRTIKVLIMAGVFLTIASLIVSNREQIVQFRHISVSKHRSFESEFTLPKDQIMAFVLRGPFLPPCASTNCTSVNSTTPKLTFQVKELGIDDIWKPFGSGVMEIPIPDNAIGGHYPDRILHRAFNLHSGLGPFKLVCSTNSDHEFPFAVSASFAPQIAEYGAILAAVLLIGLYSLIIFEIIDRTVSAVIAAAAGVGILSFLNARPTPTEVFSWVDIDTLLLLFSMMLLVSVLCESGAFDWAAFLVCRLSGGKVWRLLITLSLFTAIVSAFLDNVTTILVLGPIALRLSEALELNPVPVLISLVVFSNMGGAATPVGDPPNVIIAMNPEVIRAGIDFSLFTLHMGVGVCLVIVAAVFHLSYIFSDMESLRFEEPYCVGELRRELEVWTKTANLLSPFSKDEDGVRKMLLAKASSVRKELDQKLRTRIASVEGFRDSLANLEDSGKIRDWRLLIKTGSVLTIVVGLFFVNSVPGVGLSLGITAFLGAIFLLIIIDRKEVGEILARIEWTTLIFFAALFIVMECVAKLGLLDLIGDTCEEVVKSVPDIGRLPLAITLILWVSGLASAFVDNIPFTTMMVRVVTRLAYNVNLPLEPLVWALAFGTCLGGNGTLVGASANIVAAGLANQHGHKVTFGAYFKIGFPMMLVSLFVATVYLLTCHALFSWH